MPAASGIAKLRNQSLGLRSRRSATKPHARRKLALDPRGAPLLRTSLRPLRSDGFSPAAKQPTRAGSAATELQARRRFDGLPKRASVHRSAPAAPNLPASFLGVRCV